MGWSKFSTVPEKRNNRVGVKAAALHSLSCPMCPHVLMRHPACEAPPTAGAMGSSLSEEEAEDGKERALGTVHRYVWSSHHTQWGKDRDA